MLTETERRDKALRHFVTTWGEHKGTQMWKDYCQRSGLLEPEEAKTPEATKPGKQRKAKAKK